MQQREGQHASSSRPPDGSSGHGKPRAPSGPARRAALQALCALSVTAFTGGALARIVGTPPEGAPRVQSPGPPRRSVLFDEMYRGRRLEGHAAPYGGHGAGAAVEVYVDGRPLHLMRCADGGYVTPLDHYRSYPTAREAARGAVAELGSHQLALSPVHGGRTQGGGHGVRA